MQVRSSSKLDRETCEATSEAGAIPIGLYTGSGVGRSQPRVPQVQDIYFNIETSSEDNPAGLDSNGDARRGSRVALTAVGYSWGSGGRWGFMVDSVGTRPESVVNRRGNKVR